MENTDWIIETNEEYIKAISPNEQDLLELGRKYASNTPVPEDLLNLSDKDILQMEVDCQINVIREKRNKLLKDSDWTQMVSDNSLSEDKKLKWKIYRENLRNITDSICTVSDALSIVWPIIPQ
jgi:hypothetical protein